jgi:hypothetical protein
LTEEEIAWERMRQAILKAQREPSDRNLAEVKRKSRDLVESMERPARDDAA